MGLFARFVKRPGPRAGGGKRGWERERGDRLGNVPDLTPYSPHSRHFLFFSSLYLNSRGLFHLTAFVLWNLAGRRRGPSRTTIVRSGHSGVLGESESESCPYYCCIQACSRDHQPSLDQPPSAELFLRGGRGKHLPENCPRSTKK